jgi:hypothetical protein
MPPLVIELLLDNVVGFAPAAVDVEPLCPLKPVGLNREPGGDEAREPTRLLFCDDIRLEIRPEGTFDGDNRLPVGETIWAEGERELILSSPELLKAGESTPLLGDDCPDGRAEVSSKMSSSPLKSTDWSSLLYSTISSDGVRATPPPDELRSAWPRSTLRTR